MRPSCSIGDRDSGSADAEYDDYPARTATERHIRETQVLNSVTIPASNGIRGAAAHAGDRRHYQRVRLGTRPHQHLPRRRTVLFQSLTRFVQVRLFGEMIRLLFVEQGIRSRYLVFPGTRRLAIGPGRHRQHCRRRGSDRFRRPGRRILDVGRSFPGCLDGVRGVSAWARSTRKRLTRANSRRARLLHRKGHGSASGTRGCSR